MDSMTKYEKYLSKYATKSSDAIRINKESDDIRPSFFRDSDKIIYSLSYNRYIDKTQVFSNNTNDHISKRIIHVQFVSKIARTIGRALDLNEDLIEAIALGHDIGHVPFGHVGEAILNKISLKNNEGFFMHNVQSVRTFMNIENNGLGKNLSIQVLDGILCHNGELLGQKYAPKKKTKEEFLEEYKNCYKDKSVAASLIPTTLEGCVVRICDIIGYIGRDIEDACVLGVLKKEDIPKNITSILGYTNSSIINTIVLDIIKNSKDKPYLTMSDDVFSALKALKKFNYENIYNKANTKEQIKQYELMFNKVFEKNIKNLENKNTNSNIYKVFLNNMDKSYFKNTNARIVLDYIAGMTDDYFINEFESID